MVRRDKLFQEFHTKKQILNGAIIAGDFEHARKMIDELEKIAREANYRIVERG